MAKKKKEQADWIITKGQQSRYQKEQQQKRQVFIIGSVIVAVVLALVLYAVIDSTVNNDYTRTVLKINSKSFDMNDYIKELELSGIRMESDSNGIAILATNTLRMMETNEIVNQLAEKYNLTADEDAVTARIETIWTPASSGTDSEGNPIVGSYEENYASFIESLDAIDASEKDYKKRIIVGILEQKLKDYVANNDEKFMVPQEAEQVNIRGILMDMASLIVTEAPVVNGTPASEPESEGTPSVVAVEAGTLTETAVEKNIDPMEAYQLIKARLAAGDEFVDLVQEFSADVDSRDNEGELGWFPRGIINDRSFEDVAFDLGVGVLSEPIPALSGGDGEGGYCWLIEVTEKEIRPLEDSHRDGLEYQAFNDWFLIESSGFEVKNDYLNPEDVTWAIGKALE